MNNFSGLKYFRPDSTIDNWGNPEMMNEILLQMLDRFREDINSPLIVTSGFRPDSIGSQHRLGLAVDIVAPKFEGPLLALYRQAESQGFKGIGVYPHWKYQGQTVGGLHLDMRAGNSVRWMGVLEKGKQSYIALNPENLTKYGVV